jgi:hypothetical protein
VVHAEAPTAAVITLRPITLQAAADRVVHRAVVEVT